MTDEAEVRYAPPCPLGCPAEGPHQHQHLGEGWWGPTLREPQLPTGEAGHGMSHIGTAPELATIKLRCGLCGERREGPAILPLARGQTEALRTCDRCLDAAEARLIAKHAQQYPQNRPSASRVTYRDSTPIRVPHKDA